MANPKQKEARSATPKSFKQDTFGDLAKSGGNKPGKPVGKDYTTGTGDGTRFAPAFVGQDKTDFKTAAEYIKFAKGAYGTQSGLTPNRARTNFYSTEGKLSGNQPFNKGDVPKPTHQPTEAFEVESQ
jgi:hypothetical protein